VAFRALTPPELEWITRPHEPGEDVDLLVYAYGTPPEDEHAEILEPVV
jgi:hypothetical protein